MKSEDILLEDIVLLTEENPGGEDPNEDGGLWYWSVITFDEFMKKFGDGDLSEIIQGLFLTRDQLKNNNDQKKIKGYDNYFLHDSRRFRCRFFSNISFAKDFVTKNIPLRYECQGEESDYDTARECKDYISKLFNINLEQFMAEADKERDEEDRYGMSIRNVLLVTVSKGNDEYDCIMTEADYFKRFIMKMKNQNSNHEYINAVVYGLYQTKHKDKYEDDSYQVLDYSYTYANGRTECFSVKARFCANEPELRIFIGDIGGCIEENGRFKEDKCSKELKVIL